MNLQTENCVYESISTKIFTNSVEPDVDVKIMPQDFIAGRDSQLEKAIKVAMAQIVNNPIVQQKRPAFPVHPGKRETIGDSALPVPGSTFPAPKTENRKASVFRQKLRSFLLKFVVRLNHAVVIDDVEIVEVRRKGKAFEAGAFFHANVDTRKIRQTKWVDVFNIKYRNFRD